MTRGCALTWDPYLDATGSGAGIERLAVALEEWRIGDLMVYSPRNVVV